MTQRLIRSLFAFVLCLITLSLIASPSSATPHRKHPLPVFVHCALEDDLNWAVDLEKHVGFIDYDVGANCNHAPDLIVIAAKFFADKEVVASNQNSCAESACKVSEKLSLETPVTIDLRSSWFVILPKNHYFTEIPGFCKVVSRTAVCTRTTKPVTLP